MATVLMRVVKVFYYRKKVINLCSSEAQYEIHTVAHLEGHTEGNI